ncbi:MAG: HNH homing endonuclease (endogenous virus) [Lactobacillus phage ViSo-2018a]|uniref:HNH homing endonuclease n=1 Tax=Lactobacillus phage ViSo-2018a TaxID=2267607 RepID=A0A3G6JGU6_9CAUD|nr:MAG: HNH homing endonuclease [Lactobacillus phage ViSo-2018a]AZA17295.1 MAG: HNH homing endonuclease [Lactobacillus phage ViSo-2018a]
MNNSETKQVIWRQYPEYPFIEANQYGQVRTRDRVVTCKNGRKRLIKGKVLKQHKDRHGYMCVTFGVDGKFVSRFVHQICATCFLSKPNNFTETNHKDNDPTNNAVNNLEWCSHEYNMAYKEKFGVSAKEATKGLRKPIVVFNLETFEVLYFESQREAARQLGISVGDVGDVIKGRRKKTHGFWFCNADESAIENVRAKFGDKITKKVEKLMCELL